MARLFGPDGSAQCRSPDLRTLKQEITGGVGGSLAMGWGPDLQEEVQDAGQAGAGQNGCRCPERLASRIYR